MESEGYRVLSAVHGLDALQQMETANPDLILSDISMPEMDGFAFFDAVRRRSDWVTIPFIFLTARGERDDIFTSKRLGAEDYLVKPVVTSELVATIRSRLDRSQQLMMAQLEQAYEASLIMLSNAIELRDRYTRGHVERVTHYSMLIAQYLIGQQIGWNSSLLKPLQFGAILHDIGKIYVREDILLKTGRLNREEWDEMRQHTMVGAGLIQSIPYLSAALPIIQHHHERWDGKGYPDGLAGDQIPQGARIVSVADSYDAMTTMRVYQPASSPQQAMDEIVSGSGARYDPKVVEAFLAVWQQF